MMKKGLFSRAPSGDDEKKKKEKEKRKKEKRDKRREKELQAETDKARRGSILEHLRPPVAAPKPDLECTITSESEENGEFRREMLRIAGSSSNLGGALVALSMVTPPMLFTEKLGDQQAVLHCVRTHAPELVRAAPPFMEHMTTALLTLQLVLDKHYAKKSLPLALNQYLRDCWETCEVPLPEGMSPVKGRKRRRKHKKREPQSALTWFDVFESPEKSQRLAFNLEVFTSLSSTAVLGASAVPVDAVVAQLGEQLCRFVRTHCTDPYSSVLGLEPRPQVLKYVADSPSPDVLQVQSKKELAILMLRLSQMADADAMRRAVEEHCLVLRDVKKMRTGALVLASTAADEPYRFGRFSGRFQTSGAVVFFSARDEDKDTGTVVPSHRVLPVLQPLLQSVTRCATPDLEQYVHTPHEEFQKELLASTEAMVLEALQREPFSLEPATLNRIQGNVSRLEDTEGMRRIQNLLEHSHELSSSASFETVRARIDEQYSAFGGGGMFVPSAQKYALVFEPFSSADVVEEVLRRLHERWRPVMQRLEGLQRQWIDGTKKNELVTWWLSLIRKQVDEMLVLIGYDKDAIPWNYVQDAPADMSAVEKNLRVIRDVLDSSSSAHRMLKELILDLQQNIYPRIDSFVEIGLELLSSKMNIPKEEMKVHELREELDKRRGDLSERDYSELSDLVKDVNYLTEMKRMEDPRYALENEVNFHIVPISGLVMSSFVRLENECRTVQELWAPKAVTPVTRNLVLTDLHRYLADSDMEAFKEELRRQRDAPDVLNAPDKNGWTVLHCLSNSVELLPLCQELIQLAGVDSAIQNHDGNTALHYLVRARVSDNEDIRRKEEIMKRMIAKGVDVNQRNKHGEAPLHMSCWSGNAAMVRILLEAGGDPNLVTTKGVSCLFFAARQGSLEVVKALASFGAKLDAKCPDEPVETARARGHADVVEFLERELAKQVEHSSDESSEAGSTLDTAECGLVLESFLPLHNGHLALIDTALAVADHVHVVVLASSADPIPPDVRQRWLMRCLIDSPEFPHRVSVSIRDGFAPPKDVVMGAEEVQQWASSCQLPSLRPQPQVLVTMDGNVNGNALARALHLAHHPSSLPLDTLPSADVLDAPLDNWSLLPAPVRAYFVRRVTVIGSNARSRRALSVALSEHFHTLMMPEFRLEYHALCKRSIRLNDLRALSRKLLERQDALAAEANKLLICDTDALFVAAWSKCCFAKVPPELMASLADRKSQLYIVTAIESDAGDGAAMQDETSACTYSGVVLHDEIMALLETTRANYVVVQSSEEGDFGEAVRAVEKLLS